jgi:hypothetical protein
MVGICIDAGDNDLERQAKEQKVEQMTKVKGTDGMWEEGHLSKMCSLNV